ncbi:MAG TPA: MerR family transcriptional regulator [Pirellulales bacterium]|nr:MerR family transcriptional regulator [Pirellulales bacterium]
MTRSTVTTSEILASAGIKTVRTLMRWHQIGLLPAPEIGTHPNGRGKIAYWPAWVLDRCQEIRRLTDEGIGLTEIAKKLPRTGKRGPKGESLSSAVDRGVLDAWLKIHEKVNAFLDEIGLKDSSLKESLSDQIASKRLLSEAIDLMNQGLLPVAVWDGKRVLIVPDAGLGQLLGLGLDVFLVVPLFAELKSAYSKSIPSLPDAPRYEPMAWLESVDNSEPHELRLAIDVDGRVQVVRVDPHQLP